MPELVQLSAPLLRVLAEACGVAGGGPGGEAAGEDGELDSDFFPKVAAGVEELSHLFTLERDQLSGSYLEDDALRLAYLSYYLPVNVAKIQSLLDELLPDIFEASVPERPLTVLDVGAGPGTAALGVLDWLTTTFGPGKKRVEVVAVEKSPLALRDSQGLWEAYEKLSPVPGSRLTSLRVDLQRNAQLGMVAKTADRPFDLIVLANCLNELFRGVRDPMKARVKFLRTLLDQLEEHGTLMILEPALRGVSRHLHEVRDRLLAERACTVYSPCLHECPCPALVNRDDWCHEDRPWAPPPWVARLDRLVGFRKDSLKFSYVLLRKDGRAVAPRGPSVFRVVSELRELKGEKRVWLCNETGRPEVGRLDRERSEANTAVDEWHRGAIVRIDQIVRKDRKGREAAIGRIPNSATVEIIRPV